MVYPEKLSIIIDGEGTTFKDKTKFKQYLSTNPALQKVREKKLQPEEISYIQENIWNK